MKPNPALSAMEPALGAWAVTGSHPALPERILRGRVTFERVEGGAFVRMHARMEDPEIPEGVAIFGTDDSGGVCTMLYFDQRAVARRYEVALHADGFTWSRDTPEFSQRFRVTFGKVGSTMEGVGSMKKNGGDWEPDLRLSYVRATGPRA